MSESQSDLRLRQRSSMWIRAAVARTERLVASGVFSPQSTISVGCRSDANLHEEEFPLPQAILIERGIRVHLHQSWVLRYQDPFNEGSTSDLCSPVVTIDGNQTSSLIVPSDRLNIRVDRSTSIFIVYHEDRSQAQEALLRALKPSGG